MRIEDVIEPPLLTEGLPGLGGRIKSTPDDFEVEEIPAYEPSGEGEFLYLWIEKRDVGAEYFTRMIARKLDLPAQEIGTAGLKDRRAVTRQWVSVPAHAEAKLPQLDGDGLRVLRVGRHGNKLKPGHLHGNRFHVLIRGVAAVDDNTLSPLLAKIREHGLPNYYGTQRFGRGGETLRLGLGMLRDDRSARPIRSPFLRKLAVSAGQSALFNHYLGQRLQDGLLAKVMPGDVMAKVPFGGMFVAQDVETEQRRFDAKEIVTAGPIFGRKTFPAAGEAAAREAATLEICGVAANVFDTFGKLAMGTRRHNLVHLGDLTATPEPDGLRLAFSLPAGSYATVLLREIMKSPVEVEEGEQVDSE
jgi:tRNA pseudouridine13 synthase